jgi:hypothetical protein
MNVQQPSAYDLEIQREESIRFAIRAAEGGAEYLAWLLKESGRS